MIYTDLIEFNIVGDTKAPLPRCFRFISKLKSGDNITTGRYKNYQTFSKLQFRPLLKNSLQSIHINLRDTSGEKTTFVSVGITRLVLMFTKASNIHSSSKRRYNMVASRKVEIPFSRVVGRQRGRGFGALAQVIARNAIVFLHNYIVPAAQRVGADLLEFVVPEIAEVVSGRKNFKTAAKSAGRQTLRKKLVEGSRRRKGAIGVRQAGSRKRSASRVIPRKSAEQISRSQRDIFTNTSH